MKRGQLIHNVKKYFSIHELVGKRTYNRHGERAWKFIDDDLLQCLLVVREGIGRPMTVNNWRFGGRFSQRGLRTIAQQIVRNFFIKGKLYLSAHLFGKAVDFDVKGMTAIEVRKWIIDNKDLFPCKIRLERKLRGRDINWVHLDTFWEEHNPKVYAFDV